MDNYFDIFTKHKVTAANRNTYTIPALHPGRKLSEHDFIYMLSGKWKIGQDSEEFSIEQGDVLILPANHFHYGIQPCTKGTKTMYIHTSPHENDKYDRYCNNKKIVLKSHIKTNNNYSIKNCFEKIVYAKSLKDEIMASAYFDVLLCELKKCMENTNNSTVAEKIRQAVVSSNKILKNTEIAEMFNISVKTAENTFKRTFHTTIHQYIIHTKIEDAKFHLLNFPDMKIYEIAHNLGFYDEFHLSRCFKKTVGLSPAKYRKQIKSL